MQQQSPRHATRAHARGRRFGAKRHYLFGTTTLDKSECAHECAVLKSGVDRRVECGETKHVVVAGAGDGAHAHAFVAIDEVDDE